MKSKKKISAVLCAAILLITNSLIYGQQQNVPAKRAGKNVPKSTIVIRAGGKTQSLPQGQTPAPQNAAASTADHDAQRDRNSR